MTNATETAAVALLEDKLGATEIPPDYCRKCGRDYQPDGTCPHCIISSHAAWAAQRAER